MSNREIITRWCLVTKGHEVATKYMNGDTLIEGERILLDSLLTEWHERLSSISWFMRCLNKKDRTAIPFVPETTCHIQPRCAPPIPFNSLNWHGVI